MKKKGKEQRTKLFIEKLKKKLKAAIILKAKAKIPLANAEIVIFAEKKR